MTTRNDTPDALDLDGLRQAVARALHAVCRAHSHTEARDVLRAALRAHAPQHAGADIMACAHWCDGEVGPAYLAHLQDGDTVHTLFVSVEFGCADVVPGTCWPSDWS
jgi:hypothetical protein